MRTLGAAYSRTLRTGDGQPLVEDGPYRLVRHPGDAGSLLIWIGFGCTSRSLPVVALVSVLLAHAYGRRITAEEAWLRRDLPGSRASRSAIARRSRPAGRGLVPGPQRPIRTIPGMEVVWRPWRGGRAGVTPRGFCKDPQKVSTPGAIAAARVRR